MVINVFFIKMEVIPCFQREFYFETVYRQNGNIYSVVYSGM